MYFTQQDATFHLFDGDKIAVLAALLVRDILNDLHLPAESIKVKLVLSQLSSWTWSRLSLCMALSNPWSLAKPEATVSTVTSVMLEASPLLQRFHVARILLVSVPHLTSC